MNVEWGRLHRGRVWHVARPLAVGQPGSDGLSVPLCSERPTIVVEVTQGQPPVGALVCPRCQDDVDGLYAAITEALRNQRSREVGHGRPDGGDAGDDPSLLGV